eukprot:7328268-Ditylum_brightwellii.AAC.1
MPKSKIKRIDISKKHKFPKNHDDSSKAMEADACLILTTMLYQEQGVVVDKIVADDDSSIKAVVCHSYA